LDPFTIALAISFFGAIAIAAVVITIKRIVGWFRSRGQIKEQNAGILAFTLAERIENKQYAEVTGVFGGSPKKTQIVQGFYDPRSSRLVDARAMASSERPEQRVIDQHDAGHGLVIYT
jgi:hypothetical protein